jgi:hypothetical protein
MTGVKKRFLSIRYPAYSIWQESVIIHEKIMIGNHPGYVPKRYGERLANTPSIPIFL